MTTGLVIFSRFNSSRLPGKALVPISGRPLLGRVLDRVRRVAGHFSIVVATSEMSGDDMINAFAKEEGVDVFRGNLEDVAQRALDCARHFKFDRFARICGDRPFLPPELIDQLVQKHIECKLDVATNSVTQTFPSGMATEIISTDALEKVLDLTISNYDREHVTPYFYSHPEMFKIYNLESQDLDLAQVNLALDTREDLEKANWITARLGPNPELASMEQVVGLSREWETTAPSRNNENL